MSQLLDFLRRTLQSGNSSISITGTSGNILVSAASSQTINLQVNSTNVVEVSASAVTLSQRILLPDGSNSSPSYSFSSDLNTGIFRGGDDIIAISTNGVARLVIHPTGRIGVGIGVDTPDSTLELADPSLACLLLNNTGASANNGKWQVLSDSSSFNINTINDAYDDNRLAYGAGRSGAAVTGLQLGNSTDYPTITAFTSQVTLQYNNGLFQTFRADASTNNGFLGGLEAFNYHTGESASVARMYFVRGDAALEGRVIFETRDGGSLSERMRLTENGNLLIGVSTESYGSGTGFILSKISANATIRVERTTTGNSAIELRAGNALGAVTTVGSYPLYLGANELVSIACASDQSSAISLPDNHSTPFRILQGTDEYFKCVSINGSELITLASTTLNQLVQILGSGGLLVDGTILGDVEVEANTDGSGSPNILTDSESGKFLTNEGSTAENYHTLPTAVGGYIYEFYCQDSDGIRIVANTGDTIRNSGTVSSTAGFIRSSTVGSSIRLVAINATEWIVTSLIGTWTIDS